ncbi:MAG: carotenoid biosynthesis protein, partial [Geobacter sp.]
TVAFLIGERLMALTGLFIVTLPIAIVSVGIIRRANGYRREELSEHVRDYPWSAAAKD